jgi:5-formaminoimidazole-4-carboxamide-1-(beta)-D-ribofuranosyl 5'-monophosphate synthetase
MLDVSMGGPQELLAGYAPERLHLGCLGSHSALEVAYGAHEEGLRTVVVCERGRERTYTQHYRHLFDEVLVLERFADMATPAVVQRLRALNTIVVPNRSFAVYVGYDAIETRLAIPLFGGRRLLRAEERTASPNQYDLLASAGVRSPRRYRRPEEIDRLVIVKLPQAERAVERGFFTAASPDEFKGAGERMIADGLIRAEDLATATIEEFVVGAQFNLDYFASPLTGEVEFLGADQRIESNIEGILHMTAAEQAAAPLRPTLIPVGHRGVTVRESLLDRVFLAGERLAAAAATAYPPGLIGPFALQGILDDRGEFVCFDVSLRVPGAPILLTTSPYTRYKFGKDMSVGRRVAMELKEAVATGRLAAVVT